jgi:uncharacterized protein YkwD
MIAIGNRHGPLAGMQHVLYGTPRPNVSDRLDAVGYDDWTLSFRYSENIALGYGSAATVVAGWIASPPHRSILLDPRVSETGVAVRVDAAGRHYFTQDFGRLV